ncbi:MAG TPA: aminodeoxychorismate lyase [Usitatibacter sp.]|nr:aminodeoxychorismate lyase [Usitatibacter sp.]
MRPRLRAGHGARDEDRPGAVQFLRLRRHQRDARVPALQLILVDGVAADSIPATDRGLAFGDGVFRTLRIRAGRPLNWTWQYRRLAADCALLGLRLPEEALLVRELHEVAPGDAAAKVIVTRGAGGRGYAPPAEARGTRIVASFPLPDRPATLARDGVRVRRCELVLSQQPRTAGAKTLNRLENVLARAEWTDPAIHEGLLGDSGGRVVAGTMSNVFIVSGSDVSTPSLGRCGVIGAQRERVREWLRGMGRECAERDIAWSELEAADEVFLTNSLIGVWPVASMESRRWAPGPVARALQERLEACDAAG